MNENQILSQIHSPDDVKQLEENRLGELATEIRKVLVETVSQTGGHLASNLGVVELTIALHRVFDSPRDQIVFDVGHQAYTHKLLTGATANFPLCAQKTVFPALNGPMRASTMFFTVGIAAPPSPPPMGFPLQKSWQKMITM